MRLDLSLNNKALYRGCKIAGNKPKHLVTPKEIAIPRITENLKAILADVSAGTQRIEVTGKMTSWVYLTVGLILGQVFREVYYIDDRGRRIRVLP